MIERITVLVVTKNEEANIERCLGALLAFDDVRVVDSGSGDRTAAIAREMGADVVDFVWDGAYPKKRGWCLAHLEGLRDFVFWVDADEVVTPALVEEMKALDGSAAGYWVSGQYMFDGALLRYGMRNNKIALMDPRRMAFPVVDDLDIEGMGEIEGHYQPVCHISSPTSLHRRSRIQKYAALLAPRQEKNLFDGESCIGALKNALLHHGYNDRWEARHLRYARWQAGVEARGALPGDGRWMKRVFVRMGALRPVAAFVHSYVLKCGFLDGARGYRFALSRGRYYWIVLKGD